MKIMPDWDITPYFDRVSETCGCMLCKDLGYHERAGHLQWCTCSAAEDRQKAEPNLLETIAAERAAFAAKFKINPASEAAARDILRSKQETLF